MNDIKLYGKYLFSNETENLAIAPIVPQESIFHLFLTRLYKGASYTYPQVDLLFGHNNNIIGGDVANFPQ